MMDETGIEDLDELGTFIIDSTGRAMREAINRLPKGTVGNRMTIDGFDRPIELVASLTVGDGEIVVDFAGTSPYSDYGINCPKCYTDAYTAFGVKCVVAPKLPNNAGSLAAIKTVRPRTPSSMPRTPVRSWLARRWGICCRTWSLAVSIRSCPGRFRRKGRPASGTSSSEAGRA